MEYVYVGSIPRNLASGRPLIFGDVVDNAALTKEDQPLAEFLVQAPVPAPASKPASTPTTTEAS